MKTDINQALLAVRFLAAAGHSLSTLELGFSWLPSMEDTMPSQFHDESLQKAIAALNVKCMISIWYGGWDKKCSNGFEYLVNGVGLIKQWAIMENVLTSDYVTSYSGENYECYHRNWILKPACASTINKVPWSKDVDEIYQRLKGLE